MPLQGECPIWKQLLSHFSPSLQPPFFSIVFLFKSPNVEQPLLLSANSSTQPKKGSTTLSSSFLQTLTLSWKEWRLGAWTGQGMSSSSEQNWVPNSILMHWCAPRNILGNTQLVSLVIAKNTLLSKVLILLRDITMLFHVKKGHLYSKCHFDFNPFKIMNSGIMMWWSPLLFLGIPCCNSHQSSHKWLSFQHPQWITAVFIKFSGLFCFDARVLWSVGCGLTSWESLNYQNLSPDTSNTMKTMEPRTSFLSAIPRST